MLAKLKRDREWKETRCSSFSVLSDIRLVPNQNTRRDHRPQKEFEDAVTRKTLRQFGWLLLIVLLVAPQVAAQATTQGNGAGAAGGSSARIQSQVAVIADGVDSVARRAAIVQRLEKLGIKHRLEPFEGKYQGTNIIAELNAASGQQKTILLGAHYDRVEVGSGAVDNASGVAAVLELLAALKSEPLKNFALAAVFFDVEEKGLIGSERFVQARKKNGLPMVFINFDVFAYGDTLWVGAHDAKVGFAQMVGRAATVQMVPAQIGPEYPPSDHLSFRNAGVESLSFSLIDGREIPAILQVFKGERPEAMPRVLTIIHSPGDTIDKLDAAAVSRALPIVERAIRAMDSGR
jgi:hypothetical protein